MKAVDIQEEAGGRFDGGRGPIWCVTLVTLSDWVCAERCLMTALKCFIISNSQPAGAGVADSHMTQSDHVFFWRVVVFDETASSHPLELSSAVLPGPIF